MTGLLEVTLDSAHGAKASFTTATINRGHRSLSATLTEPGRVGACPYEKLHIQLSDANGETDATATRWVPGKQGYQPLTDLARTALVREVEAAAARRFDDAWSAAWVRTNALSQREYAELALDKARLLRDWWREAHDLAQAVIDGAADIHPRPRTAEPIEVEVPARRTSWGVTTHELAVCELHMGCEVVGWITASGQVAPAGIRLGSTLVCAG